MSQLRKTLDNKNPSELVLVAGAIAGSAEVITTYPLDTIKTHMQIHKNGNSFRTGMNIIKKSGIQGLYYGVIPSLAQVAGKASLRFTLYEKIKNSLKNKNGKMGQCYTRNIDKKKEIEIVNKDGLKLKNMPSYLRSDIDVDLSIEFADPEISHLVAQ